MVINKKFTYVTVDKFSSKKTVKSKSTTTKKDATKRLLKHASKVKKTSKPKTPKKKGLNNGT